MLLKAITSASTLVLNNVSSMFSNIAYIWKSFSNELSNHVCFHPLITIYSLIITCNHVECNQPHIFNLKVDIFKSMWIIYLLAMSWVVIASIVYLLNYWQNACLSGCWSITLVVGKCFM
jgi:hypothetical protein